MKLHLVLATEHVYEERDVPSHLLDDAPVAGAFMKRLLEELLQREADFEALPMATNGVPPIDPQDYAALPPGWEPEERDPFPTMAEWIAATAPAPAGRRRRLFRALARWARGGRP